MGDHVGEGPENTGPNLGRLIMHAGEKGRYAGGVGGTPQRLAGEHAHALDPIVKACAQLPRRLGTSHASQGDHSAFAYARVGVGQHGCQSAHASGKVGRVGSTGLGLGRRLHMQIPSLVQNPMTGLRIGTVRPVHDSAANTARPTKTTLDGKPAPPRPMPPRAAAGRARSCPVPSRWRYRYGRRGGWRSTPL